MGPHSSHRQTRLVAPSAAGIDEAAAILRGGGLVAFPTETVYGLGADATSSAAVRSVFDAKGRPATDPLIVHVADIGAAEAIGDLGVNDGAARRVAEEFWPGPLTVVVPRTTAVAAEVGGGLDTVALRCPAHPAALALIAAAGLPVAAPSANRFGRVSPTRATHVVEELDGRIDLVVDGGPTPLGVESTVVGFAGGRVRVLRPGGLPLEDLAAVVPGLEVPEPARLTAADPAPGPGMLLAHYSPSVPVTLVEGPVDVLESIRAGLLAAGANVEVMELPGGDAAAHELYTRLRALDATAPQVALVSVVEPSGLGRAVNDRLYRASHGHIAADASPATLERILRRIR